MKKIASLLLILSMSLCCFFACGEQKVTVNLDLDNNGVVENWETPFTKESAPDRSKLGLTINKSINSIDEFNTILVGENANVTSNDVVKLNCDIDCGGATLSTIDLKGATLLGNNHTITNFKMNTTSGTSLMAKGTIYDLNVFAGFYKLTISLTDNFDYSIFSNMLLLDNVQTKCCFNITKQYDADKTDGKILTISLLNDGHFTTNENEQNTTINNCGVEGKLILNETDVKNASLNYICAVMPSTNLGDEITNTTSSVVIDTILNNTTYCSAFVCENGGYICNADVNSTIQCSLKEQNDTTNYISGVVATSLGTGEVRYTRIDANINVNSSTFTTAGNETTYVGALFGEMSGGLASYNTTDGKITIDNISSIIAGGFGGYCENAYLFQNINRTDVIISKVLNKVYASQFIGSSVLGYIEKCFSFSEFNVNLDRVLNSGDGTSNVSLGLFTNYNVLSSGFNNGICASSMNGIFVGGKINIEVASGVSTNYTKSMLQNGIFAELKVVDGETTTSYIPTKYNYLRYDYDLDFNCVGVSGVSTTAQQQNIDTFKPSNDELSLSSYSLQSFATFCENFNINNNIFTLQDSNFNFDNLKIALSSSNLISYFKQTRAFTGDSSSDSFDFTISSTECLKTKIDNESTIVDVDSTNISMASKLQEIITYAKQKDMSMFAVRFDKSLLNATTTTVNAGTYDELNNTLYSKINTAMGSFNYYKIIYEVILRTIYSYDDITNLADIISIAEGDSYALTTAVSTENQNKLYYVQYVMNSEKEQTNFKMVINATTASGTTSYVIQADNLNNGFMLYFYVR